MNFAKCRFEIELLQLSFSAHILFFFTKSYVGQVACSLRRRRHSSTVSGIFCLWLDSTSALISLLETVAKFDELFAIKMKSFFAHYLSLLVFCNLVSPLLGFEFSSKFHESYFVLALSCAQLFAWTGMFLTQQRCFSFPPDIHLLWYDFWKLRSLNSRHVFHIHFSVLVFCLVVNGAPFLLLVLLKVKPPGTTSAPKQCRAKKNVLISFLISFSESIWPFTAVMASPAAVWKKHDNSGAAPGFSFTGYVSKFCFQDMSWILDNYFCFREAQNFEFGENCKWWAAVFVHIRPLEKKTH